MGRARHSYDVSSRYQKENQSSNPTNILYVAVSETGTTLYRRIPSTRQLLVGIRHFPHIRHIDLGPVSASSREGPGLRSQYNPPPRFIHARISSRVTSTFHEYQHKFVTHLHVVNPQHVFHSQPEFLVEILSYVPFRANKHPRIGHPAARSGLSILELASKNGREHMIEEFIHISRE
jgi:hypothetical protein